MEDLACFLRRRNFVVLVCLVVLIHSFWKRRIKLNGLVHMMPKTKTSLEPMAREQKHAMSRGKDTLLILRKGVANLLRPGKEARRALNSSQKGMLQGDEVSAE
jgi:hypothetical protein